MTNDEIKELLLRKALDRGKSTITIDEEDKKVKKYYKDTPDPLEGKPIPETLEIAFGIELDGIKYITNTEALMGMMLIIPRLLKHMTREKSMGKPSLKDYSDEIYKRLVYLDNSNN